MNDHYFEDEEYKSKDFSKNKIPKGDYENCRFLNCVFANGDVSALNFVECEFCDCDFSNAKIHDTSFRNIEFYNCKLLGLNFDECNELLFSVNFTGCILNFSSFLKLDLNKAKFHECTLHEVDFTESNLRQSEFHECDLAGAKFDHTILEKADFRTSYNYSIDPENNRITRARFSSSGIIGLLDKYDIEVEI